MSRQTGSVTIKGAYIVAAATLFTALITGIFLLIASQPTIQTTVSGQNNTPVTQTGAGIVNITNIDPEIAKQLGVTEAALKSFFKILEQQEVPPEDLDSTLRKIAERYKALDQKLATFTSDDPTIQSLKEQARKALENGDFERAEQLLNEASAHDLQAAREMQSMAKKRLLSAAASKAEAGDLMNTQLAYVEAAAYYRQAAELVPTDEESILAKYLRKEGSAWLEAGWYAKAQTPLECALSIREKALEPVHLDIAQSLNCLALLYHTQGRYEVTEPMYQRALSIREKALGPEHPSVATILNNLAGLYYVQEHYKAAQPLFQRALDIQEKVLGPEHPNVATSLNNLAALYDNQGQYEQAELLYQRALNIWEKALGPEHPRVATNLNNLAELYRAQGRDKQAEPLHQKALDIWEKALGPEHPDVAISLNNLAGLYRDKGHYEQAKPLYQRALGIEEKVLGPEHPDVAQSLNNLAWLYYAQGQYEQAEPLLKRALTIAEKALGAKHPDVVTMRENYATLLEQMKQADMALSAAE